MNTPNESIRKEHESRIDSVCTEMMNLIAFYPEVRAYGLTLCSRTLTAKSWSLHNGHPLDTFIQIAEKLDLSWLDVIGRESITYYVLAPDDTGPFNTSYPGEFRVSMEWWGKKGDIAKVAHYDEMREQFNHLTSLYEEALMSQLLASLRELDVTLEEIEHFCERRQSDSDLDDSTNEYNKGRIR